MKNLKEDLVKIYKKKISDSIKMYGNLFTIALVEFVKDIEKK